MVCGCCSNDATRLYYCESCGTEICEDCYDTDMGTCGECSDYPEYF